MKKDIKDTIKAEYSCAKEHADKAKEIYTDKFFEKSLLLKIETNKTAKYNTQDNKSSVYTNISITDEFTQKTKQYRILMFKIKNAKNKIIKKYDYELLNEFLNLVLYKNEFALILFLFKHIKQIRKIPNKDYSLKYFIMFFVIMMILVLIGSVFIGVLKDQYFHRV